MALVHCPNCGRQIHSFLDECPNCGHSLEDNLYPNQNNIYIRESHSNGIGIAGFVLAILSLLLLVWAPLLSPILWFFGWIFSFIGMFNSPKGLAVAGFVITTLPLLLLLCVFLFILFINGKDSGAWQELMEHIRLLM